MRLLIILRCAESCKYEMQYHYHLQGFIYSLLKESKYHYIHGKEEYKFFCFSNIFPATKNLEKNDLRTLIISSPHDGIIEYLYKVLLQSNASEVNVGTMKFRIDSIDRLIVKLPNNSPFTLITGTPIILRIPKEKYKAYGIQPSKNYDYICIRVFTNIDIFLRSNL